MERIQGPRVVAAFAPLMESGAAAQPCRRHRQEFGGFRRLCRRTDFKSAAQEWEFVRARVEREAYDPVDDLWFVLYFATESTLRTR
jgi:hypothetical protein